MLAGLVLDTQKFVQYTKWIEWGPARRPDHCRLSRSRCRNRNGNRSHKMFVVNQANRIQMQTRVSNVRLFVLSSCIRIFAHVCALSTAARRPPTASRCFRSNARKSLKKKNKLAIAFR